MTKTRAAGYGTFLRKRTSLFDSGILRIKWEQKKHTAGRSQIDSSIWHSVTILSLRLSILVNRDE